MSESAGREVTILMMPVKESGRFKKAFVRILHHILGSTASIGWTMHWLIRVDNSCFELKRHPTPPYTRLEASQWDETRTADVLQRVEVGRTTWTDSQIEELGARYFERTAKLWYDIYMNNCQTFVFDAASTLCSDTLPTDRVVTVPLSHILSMTVARAYAVITVPLLEAYFRFRGCNSRILAEHEQVSQFWSYTMLPLILYPMLAMIPFLDTELQRMLIDHERVSSAAMRYLSAIVASIWMFGTFASQPLSMVWATQPLPRRDPSNGVWRLEYRPRRFWVIEADGTGAVRDMGPEPDTESLAQDPSVVIAPDGRWKDPNSQKIPEWVWVVTVVTGIILSGWYWSFHVLRLIVRGAWKKTGRIRLWSSRARLEHQSSAGKEHRS